MVKITESAIKSLQRKSPSVKADKDLSEHDALHVICHPGFDGDLNKTPPCFGTTIHNELLVQIGQAVLLDSVAVYKSDGSFLDLWPRHFLALDGYDHHNVASLQGVPLDINNIRNKLELVHNYLKLDEEIENALDSCEQGLEVDEELDNAGTDIRITDQAIAYYMVRAELMRKQIEEAGYSAKDLQTAAIDKIDPKIFVVPKQDVIKELENRYCKDGETYSINTPVNPSNKLPSNHRQHEGVAASGLSVNRMI